MTGPLRALCRECLQAYRAEGQLRCADCHQSWLARQPGIADIPHPERKPT